MNMTAVLHTGLLLTKVYTGMIIKLFSTKSVDSGYHYPVRNFPDVQYRQYSTNSRLKSLKCCKAKDKTSP